MKQNKMLPIGFIQKQPDKHAKLRQIYEKAERLAATDYELSLIIIEEVAETVCRQLYEEYIHAGAENMALMQLIPTLRQQKIIPRLIAIHLYMLQTLTEENSQTDQRVLQSCLDLCLQSAKTVVDWYCGDWEAGDRDFEQLQGSLAQLANPTRGETDLIQPDEDQFATLDEMNGFTGSNGLIIGKKLRLSEHKSFEHCSCIGPTGSGKTAGFFIPNLLSLPHASLVVTDPKGELFEKTAAANLAQGKRVLVFNPFSKYSMTYNPLQLCRNISEVRELAEILLANGSLATEAMTGGASQSSEWITMSVPLLVAFLLYVKDMKPPKNNIHYALNLILDSDIETLKFLMMDAEPEARQQFNIFLQSSESEKTASSIRTVLASNLQLFVDPMIVQATSNNEINPLSLRERPTVLYVMIPVYKSTTMSPLMATFYSQMLNHLADSDPTVPIYFLLDEFANIGYIPNIDKALATFRSSKISISIGLQSIHQLEKQYDENTAQTILDNLKTKFILPGLSYDSAEYFSKTLGFKEVVVKGTSLGQDAGQVSISYTPQRRELLTADEIRRLEDGSLLAIVDNRKPFKDEQLRYYEDEIMLGSTKEAFELENLMTEKREVEALCPTENDL